MKIIKNLYRINFKNIGILFLYYFCTIFKIKPTLSQLEVNELFNHLIHSKGKLISERKDKFKVTVFDSSIPLSIRKYPSSDLKVFGQVFRGNEYKSVVQLYIKYFDKNPKHIIDAGGNVGYTSVFFKYIFPEAQIAIIEPDDGNFAMIQDNFSFNLVDSKLFKGGLWNKNTYLKIVRDFRDKSDWSIRVEETDEASNLKAFTVDFILNQSGFESVDIFKIDIEGAEKQVFKNKEGLAFLNHTKCIAIEIHDEFKCRKDIEEVLKIYNFELFVEGELTIGINKNLSNASFSKLT
jgi:FkbM family methyltransferase